MECIGGVFVFKF